MKKEKKYLEISFYTRVPHDHDHMLYRSLDMVHDICNYFFIFFPLLPPWETKKSKFQKNEKNAWTYHNFIHV